MEMLGIVYGLGTACMGPARLSELNFSAGAYF
jgi:hypothetical protein